MAKHDYIGMVVRGSLTTAALLFVGIAAYGILEDSKRVAANARLANITYQNLPENIRQYDKNRDGLFDASELEQLARDFELKKK